MDPIICIYPYCVHAIFLPYVVPSGAFLCQSTFAPLFASLPANPKDCKLILLTKSSNTHYLKEIETVNRRNVVVTFSLNPEPIADLWEGKWPDGVRITPTIQHRLDAAALAQELGFEIRVRIDPILTPVGWQEHYFDFVREVRQTGIDFRYWTLGTYHEKNSQLDMWRQRWGLNEMEWEPENLTQDGTHRHLPAPQRVEIYQAVSKAIHQDFPQARISLCKETHDVRKALMLCNADCNCLR